MSDRFLASAVSPPPIREQPQKGPSRIGLRQAPFKITTAKPFSSFSLISFSAKVCSDVPLSSLGQ